MPRFLPSQRALQRETPSVRVGPRLQVDNGPARSQPITQHRGGTGKKRREQTNEQTVDRERPEPPGLGNSRGGLLQEPEERGGPGPLSRHERALSTGKGDGPPPGVHAGSGALLRSALTAKAPWRAPRRQDAPLPRPPSPATPSAAPTSPRHREHALVSRGPPCSPRGRPLLGRGDRGAAGTGHPHKPATGRPPFPGRSLRKGAGGTGRARPGLRGRRAGTGQCGLWDAGCGGALRVQGEGGWRGCCRRGERPEARRHICTRSSETGSKSSQGKRGALRGGLTDTPTPRSRSGGHGPGTRTQVLTPLRRCQQGAQRAARPTPRAPSAHPLRQGPPFSPSEIKTMRQRRGTQKEQNQDQKSDLTPQPMLPTTPSRWGLTFPVHGRNDPGFPVLCQMQKVKKRPQ